MRRRDGRLDCSDGGRPGRPLRGRAAAAPARTRRPETTHGALRVLRLRARRENTGGPSHLALFTLIRRAGPTNLETPRSENTLFWTASQYYVRRCGLLLPTEWHGLSVCHSSESCNIGSPDRDAVWVEDLGGLK